MFLTGPRLNGGGSSTGSAGAVAANICMFALGTETDGSSTLPKVQFRRSAEMLKVR
jgi:hypothetical protein